MPVFVLYKNINTLVSFLFIISLNFHRFKLIMILNMILHYPNETIIYNETERIEMILIYDERNLERNLEHIF